MRFLNNSIGIWLRNAPFALYRLLFSPLLHLVFGAGYGCRFVPTCSEYAHEAISLYGWPKGLGLFLKRISRCHPFARAGYDPVPHGIAPSVAKINYTGR